MMTIEEMKQRKKQLGLSYERIAEDSELSIATVKKIFSGETETPRYETLYALSETLAPGDARYELIDGIVYDMPNETPIHNIIAGEICADIKQYIRKNKGLCIVGTSAQDFKLSAEDDKTIVQPDVFVVCNPEVFGKERYEGAPDLAIEVLSKSTRYKDQTIKLSKYRDTGVREYWIVDPEDKRIYIYYFGDEDRVGFYTFRDSIPVGIFDNKLVINFADIDDYVENYIALCEGRNQ